MSQPSQTDKQTGKRIVSRGEYVRVQGKRVGLVLSSAMLILLGGVCVVVTLLTLIGVAVCCFPRFHSVYFVAGLLVSLLFGSCAYVCARASDADTEQAEKIEEVVPLTRANLADLSASESLVRASAESMHSMQAVLLRAAMEMQVRHDEQLVRTVEGQE